jgi:hypothetical protein
MSYLELPKKSIMAKLSMSMIDERQKDLEKFLSNLLNRKDLCSLPCTKRFLNIVDDPNPKLDSAKLEDEWMSAYNRLSERLEDIRNGLTTQPHSSTPILYDRLLKQLQACHELLIELGSELTQKEAYPIAEEELFRRRKSLLKYQTQIEDLQNRMDKLLQKDDEHSGRPETTNRFGDAPLVSRRKFGTISSSSNHAENPKTPQSYLQVCPSTRLFRS